MYDGLTVVRVPNFLDGLYRPLTPREKMVGPFCYGRIRSPGHCGAWMDSEVKFSPRATIKSTLARLPVPSSTIKPGRGLFQGVRYCLSYLPRYGLSSVVDAQRSRSNLETRILCVIPLVILSVWNCWWACLYMERCCREGLRSLPYRSDST